MSVHEIRPAAAQWCAEAPDEASALAVRARDGDQAALAGFVRATQADLWRLCSYLVDRDSADDLTQDTYLRAVRSLPTYRAQAPVRAWLHTIARRVCADEITQRQRHRALFTATDPTDPSTPTGPVTADHADEHSIRTLLTHLDPDRRAAFTLTQLLGYSYAEAADITGVPVGTIRSRVARARDDLLPHLTDTREERRVG